MKVYTQAYQYPGMPGLNTATCIMVATLLAWLLKVLGVPHA